MRAEVLRPLYDPPLSTAKPLLASEFVVFAALIDGLGDATIKLKISNLDAGNTVYEREQHVTFPDRLAEMHLFIRISALSFPAPGTYQVVLLVDEDWVAHRHFRIFGPEVSP
jgi:hypothetical protein